MPEQELFWVQVSAIGQVFGAVATFAAVLVSLYIAWSARRPRLRVRIGERMVVGEGIEDKSLLMFSVTNVGQRIVHVRSLGWRTGAWPFTRPRWIGKQLAIQLPGEEPFGTRPPYEISPGEEISTYIDLATYVGHISKRPTFLFARAWPVLGLRRTSVWGYAYTAEGYSAGAKIEKHLHERLFKAELETQPNK